MQDMHIINEQTALTFIDSLFSPLYTEQNLYVHSFEQSASDVTTALNEVISKRVA